MFKKCKAESAKRKVIGGAILDEKECKNAASNTKFCAALDIVKRCGHLEEIDTFLCHMHLKRKLFSRLSVVRNYRICLTTFIGSNEIASENTFPKLSRIQIILCGTQIILKAFYLKFVISCPDGFKISNEGATA